MSNIKLNRSENKEVFDVAFRGFVVKVTREQKTGTSTHDVTSIVDNKKGFREQKNLLPTADMGLVLKVLTDLLAEVIYERAERTAYVNNREEEE